MIFGHLRYPETVKWKRDVSAEGIGLCLLLANPAVFQVDRKSPANPSRPNNSNRSDASVTKKIWSIGSQSSEKTLARILLIGTNTSRVSLFILVEDPALRLSQPSATRRAAIPAGLHSGNACSRIANSPGDHIRDAKEQSEPSGLHFLHESHSKRSGSVATPSRPRHGYRIAMCSLCASLNWRLRNPPAPEPIDGNSEPT